MIDQVMLATTFDWEDTKFPYLATPKVDGIRFYVDAGHLWSRSNKPIPNINLQRELKAVLLDGMDGELFAGENFGFTSSVVMSDVTPLEGAGLKVYIFDYFTGCSQGTYPDRALQLHKAMSMLPGWKKTTDGYKKSGCPFTLIPLLPVWCKNPEQIKKYYDSCVEKGYEGIILRSPESFYTSGRSKQMLKLKAYEDSEAVILGCEEMQSNQNEQEENELGLSKRSSAAAGKVPAGVLGCFHVRDLYSNVDFYVGGGPGLTHILRSHLWNIRHDLGGKVIKYRHLAYGKKDKPRQPQFLGFRDQRDL